LSHKLELEQANSSLADQKQEFEKLQQHSKAEFSMKELEDARNTILEQKLEIERAISASLVEKKEVTRVLALLDEANATIALQEEERIFLDADIEKRSALLAKYKAKMDALAGMMSTPLDSW